MSKRVSDINIDEISKKVLTRLSSMNYELGGGQSDEKLIFPMKKQAKGYVDRVSEQELRQHFIEVFKDQCPDLFYSIETPTIEKYRFRDSSESKNLKKQSALHDMCVFEKVGNKFTRKLNIEFKYGNGVLKNTSKDIQKLVLEKENGLFIHLLKNTRRDTLCNDVKSGVFDKLYESFKTNNSNWKNADKSIHLIIISLQQKTLIRRNINKEDDLYSIFSFLGKNGNINEVNADFWKKEVIDSFGGVGELKGKY
jgi:hypothetical protein